MAARALSRTLAFLLALTAATLGTALGPAAAGAETRSAAQREEVRRAAGQRAERALDRVVSLSRGRGVRTGRELTPALARLARRVRDVPADERDRARALLARPTTRQASAYAVGYTVSEATPHCTARFCVHYVRSTVDAPSLADADADSIPDYVEKVSAEMELVHARQTGPAPAGLGWRLPVGDGTRGGGSNLVDVYLKELGEGNLYGYAAAEDTSGNSASAYLVLDDDYAPAEYGAPADDSLMATAAHEFNHVLQFAYDAWADLWLFEATATWMEDEVHPDVDDYLLYLPDWVEGVEEPITEPSERVYGSSVWNHWLAGRYGAPVVRRAWESSTTTAPASFAPGAFDAAIATHGGADMGDELVRFAAAMAEWRTSASGFRDGTAYPDVPRAGQLTAGAAPITRTLDHTAVALYGVAPGSAAAIRLEATLPAGTAGGLALVGRVGTGTSAQTVTRVLPLPVGGPGSVTLESPASFSRITAVLVNSDVSHSGWAGEDWAWTRNAQTVTARVVGVAASGTGTSGTTGTTGTATSGSTTGATTGTAGAPVTTVGTAGTTATTTGASTTGSTTSTGLPATTTSTSTGAPTTGTTASTTGTSATTTGATTGGTSTTGAGTTGTTGTGTTGATTTGAGGTSETVPAPVHDVLGAGTLASSTTSSLTPTLGGLPPRPTAAGARVSVSASGRFRLVVGPFGRAGRATVTVRARGTGAAAAGARRRAGTLARAGFRTASGRPTAVGLRLSSRGLRLLGRRGTLRVQATVTAHGGRARRLAVTLVRAA